VVGLYLRGKIDQNKESVTLATPTKTVNNRSAKMIDPEQTLSLLETAAADGKLSDTAVDNIRDWLTNPHLAEYAPLVAEHIENQMWQELDDAFWTIIPFGTGGRRGKLYPIGTNAINDRTIGESAQGLADYVREHTDEETPGCAIAYDTRHRSRDFAELCSEIMMAAGFKVYFLDGYRSTPEISFAVREKNCACGIMITASHNPPSDNAVKVYWSTGGQLLPPHDRGVIERVGQVTEIKRGNFQEGLDSGRIVYCQEEVDAAFIRAVVEQSIPGPRDLKVIYTPLHGVGTSAVCPALEAAGFTDVEVFGLHAQPDPDFTNVPGHVANPENPAVFEAIIQRAKEVGADVVMATDPDADRLGCAAPRSFKPGAEWGTITGNQIGSLLSDFLLDSLKEAGTLTPEHYIVKTLVTTELMRRIADQYNVRCVGDLLVGFKWIGGVMDDLGPERFVFGAEESYGFLAGTHARDKDGAVAAMLLAELAARLKSQGRTLHQRLDELFCKYGYHAETQISVRMPGADGMDRMKALMAGLRENPPAMIGGMKVAQSRDYLSNKVVHAGGDSEPLEGPTGDIVILDLELEGNYVAVRPSGTEPKVKFYMFAYQSPTRITNLETTRTEIAERMALMEEDLAALAE